MSEAAECYQHSTASNHFPEIGGLAAMADAHSTRRRCRDCGEETAPADFSRACKVICKVCDALASRRRYAKQTPEQRAKSRAKARVRVRTAEARARRLSIGKEKRAAHDKVHYAVATGLLVKPSRCEECGIEAPLEGHHDDYSKPLIVKWLCKKRHMVLYPLRHKAEIA